MVLVVVWFLSHDRTGKQRCTWKIPLILPISVFCVKEVRLIIMSTTTSHLWGTHTVFAILVTSTLMFFHRSYINKWLWFYSLQQRQTQFPRASFEHVLWARTFTRYQALCSAIYTCFHMFFHKSYDFWGYQHHFLNKKGSKRLAKYH